MKLLEQLKKEWPDFTVLVRNAGRLCVRKVRKEDSTQEISQIRAVLPRTRYLQAATCLSLALLIAFVRFGCSSGDSSSSSNAKVKVAVAQNTSSNQTEHLPNVDGGLKADRIDAVRAEVKKRELRGRIDKIRTHLAKLEGRQNGCQSMKLLGDGAEPESNSLWRVENQEVGKLNPEGVERRTTIKFKGDEYCIPLIMNRTGTLAFPESNGRKKFHLPVTIAVQNIPFPHGGPENWSRDDLYLPAGYYRATGTYLEDISKAKIATKLKLSLDRGGEGAPSSRDVEMFKRVSKIYLFKKLSDEEYAHALNQQKNESFALAKKYKKEIKDLENEISQVDVWLKERRKPRH